MGAAAAAAGCATSPGKQTATSALPSATDKLNIACVGVGGQGGSDLRAVAHENIVALCDVDSDRAAKAFAGFPEVPKYADFRVMLEKQKDIDAVVIATPDHTHYFAAMAAIQAGKHVYVEKPMCHYIPEVRKLTQAARDAGVATQMGNQGHSFYGVWQLKSMIEEGWLGQVREVHCWTNRPTWPQGLERPKDTPPVPPTLDWDLWLGSAPERPYHSAYLPHVWRGWWDFGSCALGDMGCHILDAPYTALNLGAPTHVEAESSGVNQETGPLWSIIRFDFPARGDMPPVRVTWHDGGKMPALPEGIGAGTDLGDKDGGSLFIGDKAALTVGTYGGNPRLLPESKMSEYLAVHPDRPKGVSHHRTWLDACKGGKPSLSNFEYAGPFTEVVLLGNVALRTGQPIEWDAAAMQVTNLPEANQYVVRPYRAPWAL
ncbi:MAG: Gfo/Idh/MocA family oxidoreductase [Candidatus Hydrogenedentes bacterium]|nr:Gfo/Idh/MocA family oxidoreductase [Candidatus Hydrogenedentota bacterium]